MIVPLVCEVTRKPLSIPSALLRGEATKTAADRPHAIDVPALVMRGGSHQLFPVQQSAAPRLPTGRFTVPAGCWCARCTSASWRRGLP